MARPRKVPAQDSLTQREGDAPQKAGTYAARRAKAALRAAQALDDSRRLSAEEMTEAMRLSEAQLRTLDAVAAGLPVRNAREAVAAIRLKMDWLMPKPASAVDHRVGFLVVHDPYAEPPALPAAAAVVAALPEGQALAVEDEAPPFGDEGEP